MTDASDSPDSPFPPSLIKTQRAAAEAREELRRFQATLPWSREPHEGWTEPEQSGGMKGFTSSRPSTEGWTEEQKSEYDRLWAEWRRAAALVHGHRHWTEYEGEERVNARQALKHVEGAVPEPFVRAA